MLAPNGNMIEVYLQTERNRLRQIKRKAVKTITEAVQRTPVLDAEIDEDDDANWYLVNTFPGDDLKAMRYLARRRFGVFRPMQQRKAARTEGQRIGVMEPIFPGWLFVYCWGIRKMRWRIVNAPGVMGVFSDPVSLRPIIIPDDFVMRLRAEGCVYEERLTHTAQECERHQQKRQTRRPTLKERKRLDQLKKAIKASGIEWDVSTWDQMKELEPHERIVLLTRTLMPPVVGCASLRDEAC